MVRAINRHTQSGLDHISKAGGGVDGVIGIIDKTASADADRAADAMREFL